MPKLSIVAPPDEVVVKKIKVDYRGNEFTLDAAYRPAAVSSAEEDIDLDLDEGEATDDDRLAFARTICGIYERWDLEGPEYRITADDDGKVVRKEVVPDGPIPLEPKVVANVRLGLLSALLRAAIEVEAQGKGKRRRR